jgi:hypothetical protein
MSCQYGTRSRVHFLQRLAKGRDRLRELPTFSVIIGYLQKQAGVELYVTQGPRT